MKNKMCLFFPLDKIDLLFLRRRKLYYGETWKREEKIRGCWSSPFDVMNILMRKTNENSTKLKIFKVKVIWNATQAIKKRFLASLLRSESPMMVCCHERRFRRKKWEINQIILIIAVTGNERKFARWKVYGTQRKCVDFLRFHTRMEPKKMSPA